MTDEWMGQSINEQNIFLVIQGATLLCSYDVYQYTMDIALIFTL